MKVIRLFSDNFEGSLLTFEAYKEVRLQMSTGDFHTHKAIQLEIEDGIDAEVLDVSDLFDPEFYDPNYDPEADHFETPKCNTGCGESVNIEGGVCQDCYDRE